MSQQQPVPMEVEKKPDEAKKEDAPVPKKPPPPRKRRDAYESAKDQPDFGPAVEKAIPENMELAKAGKTAAAIDNLYTLEKQTRNGGDAFATAKLAVAIIEICVEANDFKGLLENLQLLAKKRAQLKQAITSMVQKAITYLDKYNDAYEKKMELLATLRTITEGKIYVENERARLTQILAEIREKEGKVKEAAEIMQEVQVETYGSMEKKEKTAFILEQMRLTLDAGDFVRAQIISRKINVKILLEAGFEALKLKYYALMIRFYTSDSDYLAIAKSYQAIYDTPTVRADAAQWTPNLKLLTLYLILAPHSNEQSDFLNRFALDKNLEEVSTFKNLVKLFLTKELMNWPSVEILYQKELTGLASSPESAAALWTDFHKRVVEHNLRVIAGYYHRITLDRLGQLLFLQKSEVEKSLSDLVVAKSVFARIDRPLGVVSFAPRKQPADLLNEWSHNVADLLELVEKTCHLIHRENIVHKV